MHAPINSRLQLLRIWQRNKPPKYNSICDYVVQTSAQLTVVLQEVINRQQPAVSGVCAKRKGKDVVIIINSNVAEMVAQCTTVHYCPM